MCRRAGRAPLPCTPSSPARDPAGPVAPASKWSVGAGLGLFELTVPLVGGNNNGALTTTNPAAVFSLEHGLQLGLGVRPAIELRLAF